MYIKSYRTRRFAGLKDLSLNLSKGLNVIYGKNESGKSTIINGIYSTLFKGIRITKNRKEDIAFTEAYKPLTGGDQIDGILELISPRGNYIVEKIWGEGSDLSLVTPEGNLIKSQEKIKEIMEELLEFGPTTYKNIVFARQKDLKNMLGDITEDDKFKRELGDLLRKSFMELDGVSITHIEDGIKEEYDAMFNRWDIDKNYPENNRGINNPYVQGLGKIIESYYEKEKLRIRLDEVRRKEEEFEEVSKYLFENKELLKDVRLERDSLEKLEEGLNKRQILELEIKSLESSSDELLNIADLWPKLEAGMDNLKRDIKEISEEKLLIDEKFENLEKLKVRDALEQKLKEIDAINDKILNIEEELENIPNINEDDISYLEDINSSLQDISMKLNAGDLLVRLNSSKDDVYISRDLAEKELMKKGEILSCKNSLRIYYKDLDLDLKLGDLDYEALKTKEDKLKSERDEVLRKYKLDSLEEVKYKFKDRKRLEDKLSNNKEKIEYILGERDLDELRDEYNSLDHIDISENKEDLRRQKQEIDNLELDKKGELISAENKLEEWTNSYESSKKLILKLAMIQSQISEKTKELDNLVELPEEFKNLEDFKYRLNALRENENRLISEVEVLNSRYYEAKNQLSDESYEELKLQYRDKERKYENNLRRGEKILKVYRAFKETKEEMEGDPMEDLLESFIENLSIITNNKYKSGSIDDNFGIKLISEEHKIPFNLLSAGTYDTVSLALRLALIEYIFKDGGFLILDDCLVDLDKERKDQAISLIKEFAKTHQIIFTTCDYNTAKDLGGNLISI